MSAVKLRINVDAFPGLSKGDVINVEADEHGTPLKKYWRRRLRDAKTDGCVEVVKPPKKTTPKRKKSDLPPIVNPDEEQAS